MERYGTRYTYAIGTAVVLNSVRIYAKVGENRKQGHRIYYVEREASTGWYMLRSLDGNVCEATISIMRLATENDIRQGLLVEMLQIQRAANLFTQGVFSQYQREHIAEIHRKLRKYRMSDIVDAL
jgi:hypothetical protein